MSLTKTPSDMLSYLPSGTGAVATTVKKKLGEIVSVKDFGAVGDGVTDDTTAIQTALNSGLGLVYLPDGVYKITGTIYVDYSKTALRGNGAQVVSSVAQGVPAIMVFSSAAYGADGKDPYTKNYTKTACSGFSLIGTRQTTVPAGGAGYIGFQIGRTGSAYFQSGDVDITHCAIFGFDTQVLFADNGWRPKFKECSFSGGNYPIWFNNPNNSGELMTFEGCWIVGWYGSITTNGGYFLFHRCSLFGSATGTFVTQNSANVMLRDCNVEVSNNRSSYLFSIETTSRLLMDGGSIVFDSNMTSPIFRGDSSYAMLILNGVSLPLYGNNLQYEQAAPSNQQVRALVQRGTNLVVQSRGSFPKAGVLSSDTTNQAVIGGANLVANGGGERGDTTPWSLASGTGVVSTTTPKNGTQCLLVTGGLLYQSLNVMGQSGRWFSFGFWAQARAGSGNIGNPKVVFLDVTNNQVGNYTVAAIQSTQTNWVWYSYNGIIPDGANIVQLHLDAGVTGTASIAFDDAQFQIY